MKNFGDIIKNNPIVVASIVVTIVALAMLFVMVRPAGSDFIKEMEARKNDGAKIDQLGKTSLTIPGPTPEAPPQTITTTVNPAVIDAMAKIDQTLKEQFTKVFKKAAEINKANHAPMIDGLFPAPTSDAKFFDAQNEYRRTLREMLGRPTIADRSAARLNAGTTIDPDLLDEELEKITSKFLIGFGTKKVETELSVADRTRLGKARSEAAVKMVIDHAKRISIYATEDEEAEDYPFHLGAWSNPGIRPQIRDIWEGQMNLWIQQDIVRAIALANRRLEENVASRTESVLYTPVKHLLAIRVFDGYVGIDSMGGMGRMAAARDTRAETGGTRPTPGPVRTGPGPGPGPGYGNRAEQIIQSADTKAILEEMKTYNPDQALPAAFNVSVSGRVSNAIYDVRHAQLDVIVDFKQMPMLFEAIGDTNFMTVLATHVTDVDEYEALEAGYAYGDSDCVQVQILIETIWLREWTSALMPKEVKEQLGIVDKPADGSTPPGTPGAPGTTGPGTPGATGPGTPTGPGPGQP